MMTLEIDSFGTTTIAMCVFFFGYALVRQSAVLREYAIPEPIVGGVVFATLVALFYGLGGIEITFDLTRRDLLLVYFFAALGMSTNVREVISYGRPLFLLVALATVFIVVQNLASIGIAEAFDHAPANGIVAGSMALIGRAGTTVAWAPFFEERFAFDHVSRLGLASNMTGLIAACIIGGPLARNLIKRYRLSVPGPSGGLDVGASSDADAPMLNHHGFLLALLRLHIAIILGWLLESAMESAGVRVPLYITCLLAGILLGKVRPRMVAEADWRASEASLTLIAYVSLGLFYTITIMSQQLWTAGEFLSFLTVSILVQSLLAATFAYVIVFRAFHKTYDAAVLAAAFVGIALGSTATTLAIMTAVAAKYGRAHKPFVIVPLACGIFMDIINSALIALFAAFV